MPSGSDGLTVHGDGQHGRWPARLLPAAPQPGPDREDVLRVTVVGGDAESRGRLTALLAGVEGIEVADWADSPASLAALGAVDLTVVVSEPSPTASGGAPQRPRLAPPAA